VEHPFAVSPRRQGGQVPPPEEVFGSGSGSTTRDAFSTKAEATDTLETLVEQASIKSWSSGTSRSDSRLLQLPQARLRQRRCALSAHTSPTRRKKREASGHRTCLGLIEHSRNRSDDALAGGRATMKPSPCFEKLRASDRGVCAGPCIILSYVLIDQRSQNISRTRKSHRELFSRAYEIRARKVSRSIRLRARPLENGRAGYATARPRASASWANGSPTKYKEALGLFRPKPSTADPHVPLRIFDGKARFHNECEEHDNAIAKYQRAATEMNPSATEPFTPCGAPTSASMVRQR